MAYGDGDDTWQRWYVISDFWGTGLVAYGDGTGLFSVCFERSCSGVDRGHRLSLS